MLQNRSSSKNSKLMSFTIAYMVSFFGILNSINVLMNQIGMRTSLDTALCYGSLFLLVGCSLVSVALKKIKIDVVLIVLFLAEVYYVSQALGDGNQLYMRGSLINYSANPVYNIFLFSLPGYVFIRALDTYDDFNRYLLTFSYAIVTGYALLYFFVNDSTEYMAMSYNMLLHVVMLISKPPRRYRLLHYSVIMIGILVIAVGGARGALVGLIVGGLLLLSTIKLRHNWQLLVVFILIVLAFMLTFYFFDIVEFIVGILENWGIESRTFDMILNPVDDISSGRWEMQRYLLENTTIFGEGLFGDRVLLRLSEHKASYAHNLFVEWLVDFGWLFGSVLIAGYLYLLIQAVTNKCVPEWRLIAIFIPGGFVMLMFSKSFLLQSPEFYVLLGLCMNSYNNRRINKNISAI